MTQEPHDEVPPVGAARAPAEESGPHGEGRPRITRGRDHKVLAGVCDGAGRYFGIDPVIFRIVLAVLSLTGGIGLIVYGMGWLVIPQEGEEQSEAHRLMSGRIEGAPLTAVLMTLVGCGLYASMLGNGANQAFSLILLFATAGAVYWSMQRRRAPGETASPVTAAAVVDAPPAVQAPPEPGGSPSWWRDPLSKDQPGYLWGPDDGPYGDLDRQAWQDRKKAVRQGRERNWPFSLAVFLLMLTALGVGTGVSWPYQPARASAEIGLAAALGVLGTAFVFASFAGRARGGPVFFSVLILAGLVGATALPRTGHGVGSTAWRPGSAAAVQPEYERGTGRGLLDLTAVPLGGTTVHTHLKVGAGQAEVLLPPGATVVLDYDLGVGETVLPGKVNDGVDLKTGQHRTVTLEPPAGTASTGTLDLQIEVGVGQVKVVR
ncbi:PspC domain-containing protein [Streptomyces sp. NBC_01198]|uniref:PspC domain-containing protein n=1 Tax=Streptomyces sp. NBC_01198 TaxID=2903769 RepID=UPI002E0D298A|nr:PspC domain-containing protein [Streptomyces sp. NBC_01198]